MTFYLKYKAEMHASQRQSCGLHAKIEKTVQDGLEVEKKFDYKCQIFKFLFHITNKLIISKMLDEYFQSCSSSLLSLNSICRFSFTISVENVKNVHGFLLDSALNSQ